MYKALVYFHCAVKYTETMLREILRVWFHSIHILKLLLVLMNGSIVSCTIGIILTNMAASSYD